MTQGLGFIRGHLFVILTGATAGYARCDPAKEAICVVHVIFIMHAMLACLMETSTYVRLTYTLFPLCHECFEASQRVTRHAC